MATYKFKARQLWSWKTFRDFMELSATYAPARAEITLKLEALRDELTRLGQESGPARYFYEAARRLLDRLFQRQA